MNGQLLVTDASLTVTDRSEPLIQKGLEPMAADRAPPERTRPDESTSRTPRARRRRSSRSTSVPPCRFHPRAAQAELGPPAHSRPHLRSIREAASGGATGLWPAAVP